MDVKQTGPDNDQLYNGFENSHNEKVNFRNYLFLREDDFTREQMFQQAHRFLGNETLHGAGIIRESFKINGTIQDAMPLSPFVSPQSAPSGDGNWYLSINPGTAINKLGQEIVVTDTAKTPHENHIFLVKEISGYDKLIAESSTDSWYLSISYEQYLDNDSPDPLGDNFGKSFELDDKGESTGVEVKEIIRDTFKLHVTKENPEKGANTEKLVVIGQYKQTDIPRSEGPFNTSECVYLRSTLDIQDGLQEVIDSRGLVKHKLGYVLNDVKDNKDIIGTGAVDLTDAINSIEKGKEAGATGLNSFVVGIGTAATEEGAFAEGQNSKALKRYSHAQGSGSIASGYYSHAQGNATLTEGASSHSEGSNTKALGDFSHAEGQNSEVAKTATAAHAEGLYTKADGAYSHTEGSFTQTLESASYAHAEGVGTIANNEGMHVSGKYNLTNETDIFQIGVGRESGTDAPPIRENAFEVTAGGKLSAPKQTPLIKENADLITKEYFDTHSSIQDFRPNLNGFIDPSTVHVSYVESNDKVTIAPGASDYYVKGKRYPFPVEGFTVELVGVTEGMNHVFILPDASFKVYKTWSAADPGDMPLITIYKEVAPHYSAVPLRTISVTPDFHGTSMDGCTRNFINENNGLWISWGLAAKNYTSSNLDREAGELANDDVFHSIKPLNGMNGNARVKPALWFMSRSEWNNELFRESFSAGTDGWLDTISNGGTCYQEIDDNDHNAARLTREAGKGGWFLYFVRPDLRTVVVDNKVVTPHDDVLVPLTFCCERYQRYEGLNESVRLIANHYRGVICDWKALGLIFIEDGGMRDYINIAHLELKDLLYGNVTDAVEASDEDSVHDVRPLINGFKYPQRVTVIYDETNESITFGKYNGTAYSSDYYTRGERYKLDEDVTHFLSDSTWTELKEGMNHIFLQSDNRLRTYQSWDAAWDGLLPILTIYKELRPLPGGGTELKTISVTPDYHGTAMDSHTRNFINENNGLWISWGLSANAYTWTKLDREAGEVVNDDVFHTVAPLNGNDIHDRVKPALWFMSNCVWGQELFGEYFESGISDWLGSTYVGGTLYQGIDESNQANTKLIENSGKGGWFLYFVRPDLRTVVNVDGKVTTPHDDVLIPLTVSEDYSNRFTGLNESVRLIANHYKGLICDWKALGLIFIEDSSMKDYINIANLELKDLLYGDISNSYTDYVRDEELDARLGTKIGDLATQGAVPAYCGADNPETSNDNEWVRDGIREFYGQHAFEPDNKNAPMLQINPDGSVSAPCCEHWNITSDDDLITKDYLERNYKVPPSAAPVPTTKPEALKISSMPSGHEAWNGTYRLQPSGYYKMDGVEKYIGNGHGPAVWVFGSTGSTPYYNGNLFVVDNWPGATRTTWNYYQNGSMLTCILGIEINPDTTEEFQPVPAPPASPEEDTGAYSFVRADNGFFAKDKLRMDWNTSNNRAELEVMTPEANNGIAIVAAGSEKLTVDANGTVAAPTANNTNIANNSKALITKEYADANYANPVSSGGGSKLTYGFSRNSWTNADVFGPNGASDNNGPCSHVALEAGTIKKLGYYFEGHNTAGTITISKNGSTVYTSPSVTNGTELHGIFSNINVSVAEGDLIRVNVNGGGQRGQITLVVEG